MEAETGRVCTYRPSNEKGPTETMSIQTTMKTNHYYFRALATVAAALMAAGILLLAAKPAHATTFTVDRTDDPDPAIANACTAAPDDCSLRGAIVAANATAGADDVTLAGDYTLTREITFVDDASVGDLDITDELTITGAGARTTIVAGGAAPFNDRIFDNHSGVTATITGLTITGGKANDGDGGGVNNEGDLTLDGVAVNGNTASDDSGGIHSNGGALNITDSTVSGNSARYVGGVYQQRGGIANITNSTISGNKATLFGGGVQALASVINVRNSTIASNESGGLGGGILTQGPGSFVSVKNTIVAGNSIDNCDTAQASGGIISSLGNNISSDDSCPFTQPTDKRNTNPLLGPLQNNGGPTDTRALLAGSPAIDAGSNTGCPATDQRGVTRPQGLRCDIGAFERDTTAPTVSGTTPAAGATGVPLNTSPTATFSKEMDPATLTTSTVKLYQRKKGKWRPVSDTAVSCNSPCTKVTLDPYPTAGTDLAANKRYKVTITTGAKDKAGHALAQNYAWTFKTGPT